MKGRKRNRRRRGRGKPSHNHTIPLSCIPAEKMVVVDGFAALNGETARLRDLGMREGIKIRVILSSSGQMIVAIDQARVGLPKELASQVFVREIAPA